MEMKCLCKIVLLKKMFEIKGKTLLIIILDNLDLESFQAKLNEMYVSHVGKGVLCVTSVSSVPARVYPASESKLFQGSSNICIQ